VALRERWPGDPLVLGLLWPPLLIALPLLAFTLAVPIVQAGVSAWGESFSGSRGTWGRRRALTRCST
jgi:hypothetical protein